MNWTLSDRGDPAALAIAERHYNRQRHGTNQFMPVGSTFVLRIGREAVWGAIRQEPRYVKHAWPGAWVCTIYRNEGPLLSSTLVDEAVAATRCAWGDPPSIVADAARVDSDGEPLYRPIPVGMITFVDAGKVRPSTEPGWCFIRAGWQHLGWTPGGHGRPSLRVLGLTPPPDSPRLGNRLDGNFR